MATGDILIFHDVDHFPVDVDYNPPEGVDVWLPIKRVTYLDETLNELSMEKIPRGYRHFKHGVDDDFFGGVEVFTREAFLKINGFNSLYRGWGLEDADLRERVKHYNLNVQRGEGNFNALQHEDSNPGIQDQDFGRNVDLFSAWKEFLNAGVATQFQTTEIHDAYIHGVECKWVHATNFLTSQPGNIDFMSLDGVTSLYEDTPAIHRKIWTVFKSTVNEFAPLKQHRDWIVSNNWGYGNRALHWMWFLISRDLPINFSFLEIGVFKGQVMSLMSILNRYHKKHGMIYGITPLNNTGDKYSKHPDVNYEEHIQRIYQTFDLDASDMGIIEGLSNDPEIIATAVEYGPYDVVFIDGCHDYEVVVSDVINYCEMVKPNGLVVIDDASNYLDIPDGLIRMDWRGLEDVSNAVRDTIEKDERFTELFAVGHNRIWRRNAR